MAVDGAGIQAKNAIGMALEDLGEADRKEVEQELEVELANVKKGNTNAIGMALEDLGEADRKEVEQELEVELANVKKCKGAFMS
jgi:hypothetical protein